MISCKSCMHLAMWFYLENEQKCHIHGRSIDFAEEAQAPGINTCVSLNFTTHQLFCLQARYFTLEAFSWHTQPEWISLDGAADWASDPLWLNKIRRSGPCSLLHLETLQHPHKQHKSFFFLFPKGKHLKVKEADTILDWVSDSAPADLMCWGKSFLCCSQIQTWWID